MILKQALREIFYSRIILKNYLVRSLFTSSALPVPAVLLAKNNEVKISSFVIFQGNCIIHAG
ncbi:hypothetical protein MTCD1_02134 [Colwellia marinimaniae]|uniref:Uncharacterized protein n=1 Tax=Colwellia marinimaniae TaxID=1513592 RepID=A0ABQ0MW87_9GAMM|nr:hypothetical protein MTCD1_02134 [Colwellia marinimaniae]